MQPPIRNLRWSILWCVILTIVGIPVPAQDSRGDTVVVVYNSAMPESKAVADHYAAQRNVPASQVFGFDLPREEQISRSIFEEKLQRPLWRKITEAGLITYKSGGELTRGRNEPKFADAKIRYLVLCYGVPVKIARDSSIRESGVDKLPAELQVRNEAAVDSELALLPLLPGKPMLTGPLLNPGFGQTNTLALSPTNGVLMTARLDGPSADLAKGLVDKALLAEKQGLWGRAYFDLRTVADESYKMGDTWIENASQAARHYGFETVIDKAEATFDAGFPMSDVALYFGWYEQSVNGPFASGLVEFVPGAVAYHLHSYSASVLRSPSTFWVGPLVAKGVTATFGFTEEPYLQFTPEVHLLAARLLFQGFSFGEAMYAAQRYLSWQTTVVGDPLYTPNLVPPQERFLKMKAANDPLLPWAQLMIVNRNIAMNHPLSEASDYIEKSPGVGDHPYLQEKLGEIYKRQGMVLEAAEPFLKAISMDPPALDQLRLALNAGAMLANLGHKEEVYALFQQVLEKFPNYPNKPMLYRRLADLASSLGKKDEADRFTRLAEAPAS